MNIIPKDQCFIHELYFTLLRLIRNRDVIPAEQHKLVAGSILVKASAYDFTKYDHPDECLYDDDSGMLDMLDNEMMRAERPHRDAARARHAMARAA